MKLQLALGAIGFFAPSALGISQTLNDQFAFSQSSPDKFVGNSVWLFGKDGVYAFSPDGSEQRSHVPTSQVCEDADSFTGPSYRYCRFNDIVSDGKKYVWAGTYRDDSPISVFDINTGSLVGTFEACKGPTDLEYHAVRDEVWVRCSGLDVNATDPTHLDVLTASNPGAQIQTDILLKSRALDESLTSSGYSVIHHSLGDIGYLTDDSNPSLFKIDLGSKKILSTIDLLPKVHGLYEAAYSPINHHIFVRALMCCTCGSPDADVESCGRNDAPGYPVSPITGKGAGQTDVTGLCGRSCSGKAGVDTIGVFEYDTKTGKVVATHALAEGIGGDPYASPDGKYIVLMGKNGGNTIRVIEPGLPGAPSTTLVDIRLEFTREGYEKMSVARDFAFVERGDKTYLVMPSGTSHKVGIVDFSDNFSVKHVDFTDLEFENGAPHGRYRGVEWAVGTDYVWTNDSDLDEHYVIDVVKGELVNTITGIARSTIVSVQNWDRVREASQRDEMMAEVQVLQSEAIGEAGGSSTMSVAALLIGACALLVGLANLYVLYDMQNKNKQNAAQNNKFVTAVPSGVGTVDRDGDASVTSSVQKSVL